MITKPEQASPRAAVWSEITDPSQLGGAKLRGGDTFTAEECMQIAEAYAKACVQFSANTIWDFGAKQIYGAEVDAWRAKFKEWQKT